MPLRPATILLTALTLTGCKQTPTPAAPPIDPTTTSTLTGIIHFNGTPPPRIPIDMSADPACAQPNLPNLTEQYLVTDHRLANVYVYIKSGAPNYTVAANTPPVPLDQRGCRYTPHVIAVQQGGSVQFLNSDATTHNIHTLPTQPGNASVDISEPAHSSPRTETFYTPELMLPVRCNNHPWMSAFINVAPNPWFAISAADGTFRIPNLPPGTYTLAAVHEKLGEQDIQITVAPKSVATASFTFTAK